MTPRVCAHEAPFTRIAEGVYSSGMPRSVAAALRSLTADWPPVGAIDSIASCAVECRATAFRASQVVVPVTRWDDLLARVPIGRIRSFANVQSVGPLYVVRQQP